MASSDYYNEHNCEPLADGSGPNHLLHLARLLIDGGYLQDWDSEYMNLTGQKAAPPASAKAVKELPLLNFQDKSGLEQKCPVCLLEYETDEQVKQMPCKHVFHPDCLLVWLNKTNSCPCCRFELPTDDPDYEQFKEQKARAAQREYELETLHDSMFG